MGTEIRKVQQEDIAAIHGIRNYYIAHSTATVNTRLRTLEETADWVRLAKERYVFFVAAVDGQVAGYGALGPFRLADGYAPTAEVSVYIHHDFRNCGIGSALLQKLCDEAPRLGLHCLVAAITADNVGSVALHKKHGFKETGLLPELAFKNGAFLDVVFMTRLF